MQSRGYEWEVHPYDHRQAVVASGITDNEDRARAHVEHVLTTEPGRARWGMVALGGINRVICLRHDDGLTWQPMFPTPS